MRVVLIVTINGSAAVADRRRHHQARCSRARAASSTLTVNGKDLTAVMDLIELTGCRSRRCRRRARRC